MNTIKKASIVCFKDKHSGLKHWKTYPNNFHWFAWHEKPSMSASM